MATITIQGATVEPNWQLADTAPKLRLYASVPFVTSGGSPVASSSPHDGTGQFYKEVICSVSGGKIVIPDVTGVQSTEDSSNPTATYTAYFIASGYHKPIEYSVFSKGFRVPASPTTTTWDEIETNMQGGVPVLTTGDRTITGNLSAMGDVSVGDDLTVADSLTVGGPVDFNSTVSGAVKSFNGRDGVVSLQSSDLNGLSGAGLTGIGTGTGGILNSGSTTLGADTDADDIGVIDLQTRGQTRLRVENDGAAKLFNILKLARIATADLPTPSESGALAELTDGARGLARFSVEEWIGPELADIRDWNCKGNDSYDNTANLQQAADDAAAEGVALKIPRGVFRTDTIDFNLRVPIIGNGFATPTGIAAGFGSVLKSISGAPILRSLNSTAALGGTIWGVTLDGAGVGTFGIQLKGADRFSLKRLYLMNFAQRGLYLHGSLMGHVEDVYFDSNVVGSLVTSDNVNSVVMPPNLIQFSRCHWHSNSSLAVDFYNGAGLSFVNCDWELNGVDGDAATGCIQLTNWTTAAGVEGVGCGIEGKWAERNRGGFFLKINPPASANARVNIHDFLCITGGISDPQDYGIFIANGGSSTIPLVTVTGSNFAGAAVADFHQAGANTSLTLRNVTYGTRTNPSGGNFSADNTSIDGTVRTTFYLATPAAQNTKTALQSVASGSGASLHISKGGEFTGGAWTRYDSTLPILNLRLSEADDEFSFNRAGPSPASTTPTKLAAVKLPAAGETALIVLDGTAGTAKRVKLTAAGGAVPGTAKTLYVD